MVVHDTIRASDYCPLIVNTDPGKIWGHRLFRFEAFWIKIMVVEMSWREARVTNLREDS